MPLLVGQHDARRSGFTLLEVLLALILAALVTMAVASAIHLHLHVLQFGRQEVEQAQLARALLRQIGQDLHYAVPLPPKNQSQLITIVANSTQSSGAGGTNRPTAPSTSSTSSSPSSSTSSDESEATETTWTSGLLGSATCLQVDVSRLPRPAELPLGDSVDYPNGVPCDVKTVTYFLGGDASATLPNSSSSSFLSVVAAAGVGLCRCEQGNAAAAYAAQQGSASAPRVDCLAPEVVGLEFSYYDGSEWLDEWDSADKKALPIAVEVAVALAPVAQEEATAAAPTAAARIYRLLVHLPAAQVSTSDTSSETSTTETSTQTSTSETSP